ncbi:hypothetical protein N7448_001267 [Penicillium atrosanguineum]|uniref:Uncharacterized protein n=1 Tax=Penicillium atrosanguineum TaxID=1132637 RepID=A0A9W9HLE8_9EURO|nr:uncharacterized protein N7443_004666 [Penicillium atrosanguineum]KAJ5133709.1 hypothetical protein N7526_005074 [Penicillium atrosanguineum]KAJ5149689.1 hypothetical protein N7448_001267 [Penicillium atrosanguineum]KAJ5305006.1 hypothetical protein N7443_004666 [Penicillium atrosanguineum]KAJ5324472.1 hypothetical protein N7476_003072 [Penicillium atrosanguineum]
MAQSRQTNLEGMAKWADNTNDLAKEVDLENHDTKLPEVIDNIRQELTQITEDTSHASSHACSESEQEGIRSSYYNFVQSQEALLRTIIGKHKILSQTPFTAPMGTILTMLEGGFDALGEAVIGEVPLFAKEVEGMRDRLDGMLGQAIDLYG